jgi:hypothetical protein
VAIKLDLTREGAPGDVPPTAESLRRAFADLDRTIEELQGAITTLRSRGGLR